ncbi:MAG: efflux RND transporter periplasmic adaptor subunit [Geminicoccaceae bacterium]
MRIKTSYAIAGILAVALAGWLWSGQLGKNDSTPEEAPQVERDVAKDPAPIAVQVRDLTAETIAREIIANGKTAPMRLVQLRAETNGRVIELGAIEGENVRRGDLLIKLDPRDREVAVLEAEALLRQREIELDAARKLGEKGFQAETSVAKAEANFVNAEATLRRAELELEHTEISAPFDGILDRRSAEIGDFLDIGESAATLLDQNPILVIGEVIETEVGRLKTGMSGVAHLVTGDQVEGTLRYIASQADEQTRTFAVELEVPNADGRIVAGVSAELRIAAEQLLAHRVSPSVLSLSDGGELGVKTVDDDNQVVFEPVEIVRADADQVWLSGLPKTIRLITVGQGFVRHGSLVQPVYTGESELGPVISEVAQ